MQPVVAAVEFGSDFGAADFGIAGPAEIVGPGTGAAFVGSG